MRTKHLLIFTLLFVTISAFSQVDTLLTHRNYMTVIENYGSIPLAMSTEDQVVVEKKIVYIANIDMQVNDFSYTTNTIHQVIKNFDAEITTEHKESNHYRTQNTIKIRVKPILFDSLIVAISNCGIQINQKRTSYENISEQYYELALGITKEQKVIERYQQLLPQATTVEEILMVEENLRKHIEELEAKEKQLKSLQKQVLLSTIYLEYYE